MIGSKRSWLWLAFATLTVLLFSPVFRAKFVYDDADYVVHNPLLSAPKLDGAAVFLTAYPPQHPEQKLYRPLVTLSYALDKAVWGSPAGFHVTNVVWHLGVVALLVVLLRQLGTAPPGLLVAAAAWLAWHPLTTEAVAWVAGRAELLAAFFVLVSLIAYQRNWSVGAVLAFGVALLCKENAVVTPALAALLEWRGRIPGRPGALGSDSWQPAKQPGGMAVSQTAFQRWFKSILQPRWKIWAGYAAVGVAYLFWRHHLFSGVQLEQVAYTGFADAVTQRLVAGKVLARYLGLALVPCSQTVFHEVEVETLRSALAVGLLAGGTAWLWWRRDRVPDLWLGWTWFFVALLPVANLLFPIGSVMAERFTYLPLIGVSLALGGWRGRSWSMAVPLSLLLAVHAGQTFFRCRDWQSDRQLWGRAVQVAPTAFLPQAQWGFALLAENDRPAAIAAFDRALALLAVQPEKLRQQFSPRIRSAQLDAELELVHQLARQHKWEAAQSGYHEFLIRHPGDARARRALADCQLEQNDFSTAVASLADLVREFPQEARLRAKYGKALSGTGRIEEACHQLERAVELDPGTILYRRHLLALLELKAHLASGQQSGEESH